MEIEIKKLLLDVVNCIGYIEQYVGSEKKFSEYDKNKLLQDAVERNLITIGEAVNAILKINPDIPITNARRIVDVRNRLTHSYDAIDNTQVWNIIINHLPILLLLSEAKALLVV